MRIPEYESPSQKDASSSDIQFTDFNDIQKTFRTGMTGGGDRSKIKGIAAKGKKAKKKKNELLVEDVDASKEERAAQAAQAQEEVPAKAAEPAKGSKPEV